MAKDFFECVCHPDDSLCVWSELTDSAVTGSDVTSPFLGLRLCLRLGLGLVIGLALRFKVQVIYLK